MIENYEQIRQVLNTPITPKRKKRTLNDLPRELRGFTNNRFRGHQSQHMRAFRNGKFGAANAGRQLTPEERAKWEKEWQAREKKVG
jgi:hypothetical protein